MDWLSLVAFWLLGLGNNYGYVVMLTAAHDIISRRFQNDTEVPSKPDRDCNDISTGAILLADIVPCLIVKITAPFFPLMPNIRMAITVILSAAGFIFVAASWDRWVAVLGVCVTSVSSGLGEATLLSYMAFYGDRNVVSTYASGTGGAGFFGSLTYAGLIKLGITPAMTVYILVIVPVVMSIAFWIMLQHPPQLMTGFRRAESSPDDVPQAMTNDTIMEKIKIMPSLVPYMVPIGLVYLFEYLINQGMFELVYFKNSTLNHAEQYRWYQVDYQIGVFISRSSVNIIQIDKLWLISVFQGVNLVFFTAAAIIWFLPSYWIAIGAVFWEGLLGGAAYVNTFHKIARVVAPEKREFSLAITSLADAFGISLAGYLAIPIHNAICELPTYQYN